MNCEIDFSKLEVTYCTENRQLCKNKIKIKQYTVKINKSLATDNSQNTYDIIKLHILTNTHIFT